jgi:TonB family protein
MRKTTFVKPLSCRITLFCLFALGLACLPLFAQEAAPAAALPGDPTAFMLSASQSNGLSQIGNQTWHLKVTFRIFDEQGNAKDQGIFEEFYVSPNKFKRGYSSSGFSQAVYGTDKGWMQTGDKAWPEPLLARLRGEFVIPLPIPAQISQSDIAAEQREIDGAKYMCLSMHPEAAPSDGQEPLDAAHSVRRVNPQLHATYCFDAGSDVLRISLFDQDETEIVRNRPVLFQGHSLPGDLELKRAGKLALTVHLESIEPIAPIDETVFTPPPEATPIMLKLVSEKPAPGDEKIAISAGTAVGLLNATVAPVYPPIAKAAHVQGTVVLQAVIGKDGQIRELHVISGPAMLQQAAMDAVKAWVYRPYMLNGKPVEVLTTVNVIFTLGDKPQPNQPPPATR